MAVSALVNQGSTCFWFLPSTFINRMSNHLVPRNANNFRAHRDDFNNMRYVSVFADFACRSKWVPKY